ncbi:carbohydrate ABC transporter permease [Paenibacillus sp. J2TS4]|uniref:carbohydrate ABC transporter permease n=1 Tax=Paenibacillus sp. J2TS4 TaxID=2807194 RepID=UPI001B23DCD3|nr:sugar ABC transporter permease [Paenibacillus sp. J2TS4]GIP36664.1 ABC transporter permease [Paenibacillus sp. J2TS4]
MTLFRKIKPYLYLAPAVIPIAVFVYYPLVKSMEISFLSWNMVSPNRKWVGFDNYKYLLTNSEFWKSVWNTGVYTFLLLLLLLVAPFLVAFAVTRVHGKLQAFYKSAIFVPTVLSLAVSSIVFLWLLNPISGSVNHLIGVVGLPSINWLSDPKWALISIVVITSWKTFGYHFILLLSGILAVPQDVVEAARIDGVRSSMGLIRRIYIPLSSGTLLFVFVITVVFGIQWSFVPIQMLTNGGPDQATTHLVYTVYQFAFQFFKSGLASAVSVLTFLVFSGLIIFQAFVMERRVHYEN